MFVPFLTTASNTEISFPPMCVDHSSMTLAVTREEQYMLDARTAEQQLEALQCDFAALKLECLLLQRARDEAVFGVHWIEDDDKKTAFYTGLPSYSAFSLLATYLQKKACFLREWRGKKTLPATDARFGPRPWKDMSIANQLFTVLVRLRLGLWGADAAARFRMSEATYCRLFTPWVLFLDLELRLLFPWPSRKRIDFFMPAQF